MSLLILSLFNPFASLLPPLVQLPVFFYEGCMKPEVEWAVVIATWDTL